LKDAYPPTGGSGIDSLPTTLHARQRLIVSLCPICSDVIGCTKTDM